MYRYSVMRLKGLETLGEGTTPVTKSRKVRAEAGLSNAKQRPGLESPVAQRALRPTAAPWTGGLVESRRGMLSPEALTPRPVGQKRFLLDPPPVVRVNPLFLEAALKERAPVS